MEFPQEERAPYQHKAEGSEGQRWCFPILNSPQEQTPPRKGYPGGQEENQKPRSHLQLRKLVRLAASVLRVGELGEQKLPKLRALEQTRHPTLIAVVAQGASATGSGRQNRGFGKSPSKA